MASRSIYLKSALLLIIILSPTVVYSNTCIDCHKDLTTQISEREKYYDKIRLDHLARGVSCSVECHIDFIQRQAMENYEEWKFSVHGINDVTCDKCHGGDPTKTKKEDAHIGLQTSDVITSEVYYKNVPKKCRECHSEEYNQMVQSEHYSALVKGKLAPSCVTCHQVHSARILRKEEIPSTCGNCHSKEVGVAPTDIPEKAKEILNRSEELKKEIIKVEEEIKKAEVQGKDVIAAKQYLSQAKQIKDSLPPLWHKFILAKFAENLDSAFDALSKAEGAIGIKQKVVVQKEKPNYAVIGVVIALMVIIAVIGGIIYKRKE
ncbi:MAG: cytochrome c3 family protein [Candidatus Hydrothermarchaeota archaeon]